MHITLKRPALLLSLCCVPLLSLAAQQPATLEETLLLQEPTLSAQQIVFRYANDLWIVSRSGGEASRLTSNSGREYAAQLSVRP